MGENMAATMASAAAGTRYHIMLQVRLTTASPSCTRHDYLFRLVFALPRSSQTLRFFAFRLASFSASSTSGAHVHGVYTSIMCLPLPLRLALTDVPPRFSFIELRFASLTHRVAGCCFCTRRAFSSVVRRSLKLVWAFRATLLIRQPGSDSLICVGYRELLV